MVVIKDPKDYANVLDLRISLSDQGRKTVVSLANKSYDACMKTKVPRPRNCPFAWTNPVHRYRNGSVTWRQIGSDPFNKPTVQLAGRTARVRIATQGADLGTVRVPGPVGLTCSGSVTGTGVASIRVDREKLSVVWLRRRATVEPSDGGGLGSTELRARALRSPRLLSRSDCREATSSMAG